MPVRNEGAFIARSLGAVLAQDYPPDLMQVLVADGMSDDATREVVEELARAHPAHTVEIVDNPGGIVPTGFNAALSRARGEVVVRVDGHTVIAKDYVSSCVTALERSGADNVGGRMDAEGHGRIGEAIALATSSPFGVGDSQFHYASGEHWVDTVYLGAWRREVFDRVGGFDPEMVRNQDDEFNYRLRAAGGRILLTDRIRSRYYSRASLRRLFRQYRQYGFWKVRVLQKHPKQMSLRQFVPPAFAAAVVGEPCWHRRAAAFAVSGRPRSPPTARRRHRVGLGRPPLRLASPAAAAVAFAAMHLGYGGGFLAGLVRFGHRWGDRSGPPPRRRRLHAVATKAEWIATLATRGGLMETGEPDAGSPRRRVVFIGGLDDGRRTVQELLDHPRVDLVGVFVLDEQAVGAVSGFRTFDDIVAPPVLRKIAKVRDHADEIAALRPDLIVVVGFSQIIPPTILPVPPLGVIGFHTAVLPGRRGSSPVIWAIVDGLPESGVTMFYMDEGIDTGDVIAVERFPIEDDDYAVDVLRKADDATLTLLRAHLEADPRRHGAAHQAGRHRQHLHAQAYPGRRGDRLEPACAGDRQPGQGAVAALPARPHVRWRRRAGAHREGQGRAGPGPAAAAAPPA